LSLAFIRLCRWFSQRICDFDQAIFHRTTQSILQDDSIHRSTLCEELLTGAYLRTQKDVWVSTHRHIVCLLFLSIGCHSLMDGWRSESYLYMPSIHACIHWIRVCGCLGQQGMSLPAMDGWMDGSRHVSRLIVGRVSLSGEAAHTSSYLGRPT